MSTQLISYVGLERCDFVYYLQKLLAGLNKNVLVIDNSESHDLIITIAKFTGDEVIQRKRTIFLKDREIAGPIEMFDYIIVYHGLNPDADIIAKSDEIICCLTYDKIMLEKIQFAVELAEIDKPCHIIWRDKTSGKISEKNEEARLKLVAKSHYITMLDPEDISMYVSLTHNGSQSLKKAKTEVAAAVSAVACEITGAKPNDIKKIIKNM